MQDNRDRRINRVHDGGKGRGKSFEGDSGGATDEANPTAGWGLGEGKGSAINFVRCGPSYNLSPGARPATESGWPPPSSAGDERLNVYQPHCIVVDHSPQDAAPVFCLPSDGIGAHHLSVMHIVGLVPSSYLCSAGYSLKLVKSLLHARSMGSWQP